MLALTKPKFFVPTHGEYRMLIQHSETAKSMGVPPENIVIIDNGDVVEVTPDSIAAVAKVKSGLQLMDQSRSGRVDDSVMKERQQVATDGLVTVACSVDAKGKFVGAPQVSSVAVAGDLRLFNQRLPQALERGLSDIWPEFAVNAGTDWVGLQDALRRQVERVVKQEISGRPLVKLMLQTPDSGKPQRNGNGSGNSNKVITKASANSDSNDSTSSDANQSTSDGGDESRVEATTPRIARRTRSTAAAGRA